MSPATRSTRSRTESTTPPSPSPSHRRSIRPPDRGDFPEGLRPPQNKKGNAPMKTPRSPPSPSHSALLLAAAAHAQAAQGLDGRWEGAIDRPTASPGITGVLQYRRPRTARRRRRSTAPTRARRTSPQRSSAKATTITLRRALRRHGLHRKDFGGRPDADGQCLAGRRVRAADHDEESGSFAAAIDAGGRQSRRGMGRHAHHACRRHECGDAPRDEEWPHHDGGTVP